MKLRLTLNELHHYLELKHFMRRCDPGSRWKSMAGPLQNLRTNLVGYGTFDGTTLERGLVIVREPNGDVVVDDVSEVDGLKLITIPKRLIITGS